MLKSSRPETNDWDEEMRSICIEGHADGASSVQPLPLPFRRMSKPVDPETFRRQARGENIGYPRLFGASVLRSLHCADGELAAEQILGGRQLCFVVSGVLELAAGNDSSERLQRGDVFLLDGRNVGELRIACAFDCRILLLEVAEDWVPEGTAEDVDDGGAAVGETQLVRMYKGDDEQSYFRPFDTLFGKARSEPAPPVPVQGFHFIEFPPGAFIDWHPEGVNNFVVVLTGGLELEVGGGGGEVKVFGPGDVCLAEDRTGVGHIDRVHGTTRMALIVIEDRNLWPVNREAQLRPGRSRQGSVG